VDAAAGFRSPRTYADVAPPVRLRIPAIGVDASIERLGLDVDGTIAAPQRWGDAGWYAAGPRPGQPGPAVILGHVDSGTGPAVFYRLAALAAGTLVLVDRADGTTARFRVSGRLQVAKSQFPADLVYGPTLSPSLRLVTCGGDFDRRTRHYTDNIVLTAVPDRSAR
jgi:sortase (surface protein transpeptidase)